MPDFSWCIKNKTGKRQGELIEVKPTIKPNLNQWDKNKQNQAAYIVNRAKWEAANKWAKHKGIRLG